MAETLTLKNFELLRTLEGLIALDGTAGSDGGVKRYDFDASLAWNIAKNRRIFEDARRTYDMAVRTLANSMKIVEGQKLTEENAKRVAKFMAEREELGEHSQELAGVLKLSRRDLQKCGVNIPGVLSALMPILIDT